MIGGIDDLAALRLRLAPQRAIDATRRLGRLLKLHLRPGDLFTAWDADEQYAVAFRPDTSPESALALAHRLCALAGQLDWEDIAPGFVMSASFGLAVFGASEDLETALLRADWALHDVRHEGRGRARAIW
jgi:GGDEF domain-containing protein